MTASRTVLTIDPELQALIPPLTPQERELLEASLKRDGCKDPILYYHFWPRDENGSISHSTRQQIILDGHNRYEICERLKIPYSVEEIDLDPDGESEDPDGELGPGGKKEAAKLWILEHQAGRRNLTDDQRAVVWDAIATQREKVRLAARPQNVQTENPTEVKTTSVGIDTPAERTRAAVAKESGLPEHKLKTVRKLKKVAPALVDKVRNGELTLKQATKQATPTPEPKRIYKLPPDGCTVEWAGQLWTFNGADPDDHHEVTNHRDGSKSVMLSLFQLKQPEDVSKLDWYRQRQAPKPSRRRTKQNYCPGCKAYTTQDHVCSQTEPEAVIQ